MSAATPRGELLLRDGDPRPFVLVEFNREPLGVAVSWGDQIEDDDVENCVIVALAAMTGVPAERFATMIEAEQGP